MSLNFRRFTGDQKMWTDIARQWTSYRGPKSATASIKKWTTLDSQLGTTRGIFVMPSQLSNLPCKSRCDVNPLFMHVYHVSNPLCVALLQPSFDGDGCWIYWGDDYCVLWILWLVRYLHVHWLCMDDMGSINVQNLVRLTSPVNTNQWWASLSVPLSSSPTSYLA